MKKREIERLVRSCQGRIYRYLLYLGADVSVAEDIVQEAFVVAVGSSRLDKLDFTRQVAYLRKVARNLYVSDIRRGKANPVKFDSSLLDGAEEFWVRQYLRGDDGFDYIEALRLCCDSLPPRQRLLVEMQYAQGKGRQEISDKLGIGLDGVKALARRIRGRLGDCVNHRLRTFNEGESC